jgi:hypothetical protein
MTNYWDRRGKQLTYSRESQCDVDLWWEKNKDKQWSPERGLHTPDTLEPTDEELKLVEKSLDRTDNVGETCLCSEVVTNPVTSQMVAKTPGRIIPSANSLELSFQGNQEPTRVVPDTVTSSKNDEKTPCPTIPS